MSKSYRRYNHFTMILPQFIADLVQKECFEMGVSKQEFIRQIVRVHLSKKYGKDVFADLNEIKEENRKKL